MLDNDIIRCPIQPIQKETHRVKNKKSPIPYNLTVARPVHKAERRKQPQADKAMQDEWQSLRDHGVWDETNPQEWEDVRKKAQKDGRKIHLGYLFGICVQKNSELPDGNPAKKYKGRVVFQGNRVVDENYEAAQFGDGGSAPATIEANKWIDAMGCLPGHELQTADATRAYIQADLSGVGTWVHLPEEAQPKSWKGKFVKPVVTCT